MNDNDIASKFEATIRIRPNNSFSYSYSAIQYSPINYYTVSVLSFLQHLCPVAFCSTD